MKEYLARRGTARQQFAFAREAKAMIPAREDFLLAKSHRGLHLLARDEASLHLPRGLLEAAYGASLEVGPRAASRPVLEIRLGFEKRYLRGVWAALSRRGANPSVEYAGVHYCVLRFETPADAVLGLPVELAQLTAGRYSHQIILAGSPKRVTPAGCRLP